LRQSIEKLDTLIRLTTDLKSTTATPLKSPPFAVPNGAHPSGSATATPMSEARRHVGVASMSDGGRTADHGGPVPIHLHSASGASGTAGSSPAFDLHPDVSATYSPADLRIITFQNMAHRQEDMAQMQRLYDNLTQQLRRLFEEKAQLVEELTECKSVIGELQNRLRIEAEASQSTIDEMKTEFESQLRSARLLTQEAKEQVAALKASEKRYQETERDLNMRIADLDTQLNSRVVEVTNTRTSLAKAQQRVTSLQDELALVTSTCEDHDLNLQDLRRKNKELARTSLAKDDAIVNLQKELTELHHKLKKPFTTSAKSIENTEKRINYEYEISLLKDSVLAIQESEAELQKEYLNLQAESKTEIKRIKDATSSELTQANAEHEAEMERMRKELQSRKRHLEQQTRLRSIAEDELAELRVQFVKHEEALTQCKLENSELQHGNELARNQVEELQDKLAAKQDEISKVLNQLQRARKRIEKVEAAHDEKEKALAEVNLRQQRLQQSIRSHAEREIDHLNALKHTMQSAASRLSAAEQVCYVSTSTCSPRPLVLLCTWTPIVYLDSGVHSGRV
jgi:chromosome segregation ATPase